MNNTGEFDPQIQKRISRSDLRLCEPERLAALTRCGLMDTSPDSAFDRLARLASTMLRAPLTIISLFGPERQFFKAAHGLPLTQAQNREIPIEESICRYTLSGEEMIVGNTEVDALLMFHPTCDKWGVRAFMAIPMVTDDRQVLGAFCAIDTEPRIWSPEEIEMLRELTASVMTEIRLREKIVELETQREVREHFVATLTHDLRTPLSVTKMATEVLRDTTDRQEQNQYLNLIADNVDRADQMIQDLLNASLIKAGAKVYLEYNECNLNQLIEKTVKSLTALHGSRFQVTVDDPISGIWDAKAVRRMIENLALNAVKYGSREALITIRARQEGQVVKIEVHNVGNPISEENLETLFAPYRRAKAAEESQQTGWGIGLTLVRGFAEALGGSVQATSSPGDGTTFTITLPVDATQYR